MTVSRRQLLKSTLATTLHAAALGGIGVMSGPISAQAASTNGYRALVCVFLNGGMDAYDTLLPYDPTSYTRFANIRATLLSTYGASRDRSNLLPITPLNAADFGGRQFALAPDLPAIQNLFETGDAAIVANVGPLLEPLQRSAFISGARQTPPRLFSHNDQASTWLTMRPEGAQIGWGGRFADEALLSAANTDPDFTVVTTRGTEAFLAGAAARPYQLGLNGAQELDILVQLRRNMATPEGARAYQMMRDHLGASNFSSSNLVDRDIADANFNSLNVNERYNQARTGLGSIGAVFPGSDLGEQLHAVAETIALRNTIGASRQIFYVSTGGFDTHAQQAATLPGLHANLDRCIDAFMTSMRFLGVADSVTLFTASDFGRTLVPNGDGTDHGWGGHQFVFGEAVNGRRIYGQMPPYELGHDQDAGNGRLIPTLAVEQMAEPLGRWFGLNNTELQRSLPNLSTFGFGAVPVL